MRWAALPIAAAVVASCGGAAPPGQTAPDIDGSITVLAAASLTDAFERAADAMRGAHPGTAYTFSFGSSSTLATQIGNGAPADVFASADEPSMRRVTAAGLAAGAPTIFTANRLAIAVAPGNPEHIAGLADLARSGLVVVLAAPTVPAGRYALDALAKAGVSVTPSSQEVDVRAVLNKVALGEADAGIVYVTDVRSAGPRVSGVAIDERYQVVARYPAAVISGSHNERLARAFVAYLLSDGGRRVLDELGFSPP